MIRVHVDCTLRDGGYYNNWDFSKELVEEYIQAMVSIKVDVIELGFRTLDRSGFKGAYAFTTDEHIRSLKIPDSVKVGVMVNGSEFAKHSGGPIEAARLLFKKATDSPVHLIRVACHYKDVESVLPACDELVQLGYVVGVNLMQIAERSDHEIQHIAEKVGESSTNVLYFADSLGGLSPDRVSAIISLIRSRWKGEVGIHTHDNMGHAVSNTLKALEEGVKWYDSTVTGMGRGPGNAQTEYVVLEVERNYHASMNITPLLSLIELYFKPLQLQYGWGKNPFYYLSGKHSIHPTFIQMMLDDKRYDVSEVLAVIDHLKEVGGDNFNLAAMEAGRQIIGGESEGTWCPKDLLENKQVLIVGAGPSVKRYADALESYIRRYRPIVIALNSQTVLKEELIKVRAACHPFRLLAESHAYQNFPHPLIVPMRRLLESSRDFFSHVEILDFGLNIQPGIFQFGERSATCPNSLAVTYALAVATCGKAASIFLAGFDGYGSDDPRTLEMDDLFRIYEGSPGALNLVAITPTKYKIATTSVYAF